MATNPVPQRIDTTHPLAGKKMIGAEVILQTLADEGVDTIFGYSGGAILPTYDGVFRYNTAHPDKPIRLIVPANEQGAGFMAAGYARAGGKVGTFLVTSGPGATNCVTPIRDCMADSIPVVLITGQVARAAIGSDAFQEAPVFNIMSACAKHVFLVTDEHKLEATIRSAYDIARSGRPGPVVIDVPKDVQIAPVTFQGAGRLRFRGYEERLNELFKTRVSKENGAAFYDLLKNSKRPLVYVGGGVNNGNAADELRAFVRKFQLPTVTTLMGIGALDTTDPLALHMLGMHGTAYANYAVQDCDLLISVGARFDDRVVGDVKAFIPKARIAHIDIDAAEIGKVKRADWSQQGDVKRVLLDLLEIGRDVKLDFSAWCNHCRKLKEDFPLNFKRDGERLIQEEVLEALNTVIKGEAIITTGVGQHQMWAAQYLDVIHSRSFLTSGSMGTMGFGLPAAIGAAVACPGRLVIDVDGDGSLRMNLGEMETATTYGVPVKIMLMNNLGDGMVLQWQDLFFDKRYSGTDKSLHKKDFVKAAEADGFGFARRLSERRELLPTLREFCEFEGPAFLEVQVAHSHVYPMIPPGKRYQDMITGPHINERAPAEDMSVSGDAF